MKRLTWVIRGVGLAVLIWGLGAQTAQGAELMKVGIMDLQRCIQESESGKKALKKLQERTEKLKKELDRKKAELEKAQEEFKKQTGVLNAEARSQREKEMLRKQEDFRDLVRESEETVRKEDYEATQPILKGILEVAQKIGQEEGYTLILESKSGVVYATRGVDITEKVIKTYDTRTLPKKDKK
jgi:outer membrane protein